MQLPGPVRATVGFFAVAADEAKRLPDLAIELPMLAVSTALQLSLRAQQRYAALTARGDDVLRRRAGDEPPPWATFDAPVPDASSADEVVFDRLDARLGNETGPTADAADQMLQELFSSSDDPSPSAPDAGSAAGVKINVPRHTEPSRFDSVDDD